MCQSIDIARTCLGTVTWTAHKYVEEYNNPTEGAKF